MVSALTEREPRPVRLPELLPDEQARLSAARVLVVGAGALGSWSLLSLASAGVGTIGILDGDVVEGKNVPHQMIHGRGRIGSLKVDSAARGVRAISPQAEVICHGERLHDANAAEIVAGYDVVVDGLDNAAARYALGDATARLGIPFVSAGVFEFEGQVTVLNARRGPCYRCLYPTPPPAVTSPPCTLIPVVIGSLQAIEVVKLVAIVGRPLIGRLLIYDALEGRFNELGFVNDPACSTCSKRGDWVEQTSKKREAVSAV